MLTNQIEVYIRLFERLKEAKVLFCLIIFANVFPPERLKSLFERYREVILVFFIRAFANAFSTTSPRRRFTILRDFRVLLLQSSSDTAFFKEYQLQIYLH
ncbi:Protein NLRC3 [Gigaspora margarita]|uniref:Protein NLRC3 n=1 Tax=Gigaspora margarita TaxID=4874 RepID=A0A8H4ESD7_GIGMA|nr:Protein NLRC3 [Gigaspora margarita]